MPQVAEMIQKDYHKTPMLQDPDEAVAKGAAIFASQEREFQDFVEKEAKKSQDVHQVLYGGRFEKRRAAWKRNSQSFPPVSRGLESWPLKTCFPGRME